MYKQGIAGDTNPLAQGICALILDISWKIYIVFKSTFKYLSTIFTKWKLYQNRLMNKVARALTKFF